tara:strand:- start:230 stop:421 length:192 start_codon:yes stop_codon:yes gene_type:complete
MNDKLSKRAVELMLPIERQIMMCDSREETLLFACLMLDKSKTIVEAHLGETGRRQLFIMGDEV